MSSAALEVFVKKYQTARSYKSKEMRLTMQEAEELSTAISLMLTKIVSSQEKIIELQDQLLVDKSDIKLSGGSFF